MRADVRRTITKRLPVAVHDPAPAIDAEALGGDGRSGDAAAQAFQSAVLVGLAHGSGVQ
jgi:hypothetical protein